MKKRVLVLSASPRKGGNSDALCDEFIRGAMEVGHHTDKIFFRDKIIAYCTGCGVCFETHECVLRDDMAEILDLMVRADVLVLATPVYFYMMDAQMKTIIDRTVPRYTEITDKDVYLLVTAAEDDKSALTGTIEGLKYFAEGCLGNSHVMGIVYGIGVWESGEIVGKPAMTEAYNFGAKLSEGFKRGNI